MNFGLPSSQALDDFCQTWEALNGGLLVSKRVNYGNSEGDLFWLLLIYMQNIQVRVEKNSRTGYVT